MSWGTRVGGTFAPGSQGLVVGGGPGWWGRDVCGLDDSGQGRRGLGGRLVAVLRPLGHQGAHQRCHGRGDAGTHLLHRDRLFALVLEQLLHRIAGAEGRPAGQQEIQGTPQAVQVRAGIRGMGVAGLFRGEEVEGAHDRPLPRQRLGGWLRRGRPQPGQAEVEYLNYSISGKK